jgi:hypothetical protein
VTEALAQPTGALARHRPIDDHPAIDDPAAEVADICSSVIQ